MSCVLAIMVSGHAYADEENPSQRYLGLTIGTTATPYLGSDQRTWLFPVYRTFDDSAITDELFMSRDGSFGLRWTRDNGVQVGLLARLQPLGYKASDNVALTGMADRDQTFEVGPFVGWRGERIHVDLTIYADALDEHGGQETRLVVSMPFEVAHQFLILHLDVYRQSADMSDYYFGVLPGEATVGRAAYAPGATVNTAFGLRTGWHIGKRLGVFLDASMDFYDSAIEASPIVDSSTGWNISIGMGYNF
jgi:outer membrane protein